MLLVAPTQWSVVPARAARCDAAVDEPRTPVRQLTPLAFGLSTQSMQPLAFTACFQTQSMQPLAFTACFQMASFSHTEGEFSYLRRRRRLWKRRCRLSGAAQIGLAVCTAVNSPDVSAHRMCPLTNLVAGAGRGLLRGREGRGTWPHAAVSGADCRRPSMSV